MGSRYFGEHHAETIVAIGDLLRFMFKHNDKKEAMRQFRQLHDMISDSSLDARLVKLLRQVCANLVHAIPSGMEVPDWARQHLSGGWKNFLAVFYAKIMVFGDGQFYLGFGGYWVFWFLGCRFVCS